MKGYSRRLRECLSSTEKRVFERLSTPQKVQDYLDSLPNNFNQDGDTYMSPRRVIRSGVAHCAEGAIFAAAALAYHGEMPLLMDLKAVSAEVDVDHVVALFRRGGYWGAISKTNYPVLRYRDPIYPDPHTLALSYFHEYFLPSGRKTLRMRSGPFDLSQFAPEMWVTAEEELDEIIEALDGSPHFPLVPKKNLRLLRTASKFEIRVTEAREWKKPSKKR
jgi:hypothetical protein